MAGDNELRITTIVDLSGVERLKTEGGAALEQFSNLARKVAEGTISASVTISESMRATITSVQELASKGVALDQIREALMRQGVTAAEAGAAILAYKANLLEAVTAAEAAKKAIGELNVESAATKAAPTAAVAPTATAPAAAKTTGLPADEAIFGAEVKATTAALRQQNIVVDENVAELDRLAAVSKRGAAEMENSATVTLRGAATWRQFVDQNRVAVRELVETHQQAMKVLSEGWSKLSLTARASGDEITVAVQKAKAAAIEALAIPLPEGTKPRPPGPAARGEEIDLGLGEESATKIATASATAASALSESAAKITGSLDEEMSGLAVLGGAAKASFGTVTDAADLMTAEVSARTKQLQEEYAQLAAIVKIQTQAMTDAMRAHGTAAAQGYQPAMQAIGEEYVALRQLRNELSNVKHELDASISADTEKAEASTLGAKAAGEEATALKANVTAINDQAEAYLRLAGAKDTATAGTAPGAESATGYEQMIAAAEGTAEAETKVIAAAAEGSAAQAAETEVVNAEAEAYVRLAGAETAQASSLVNQSGFVQRLTSAVQTNIRSMEQQIAQHFTLTESEMRSAAATAALIEAEEVDVVAKSAEAAAAETEAAAEKTATVAKQRGTNATTDAAIAARVFTGSTMGAARAAGSFLTQVLPLGPLIKAAFPVIGAVALIEIIVQMTKYIGEAKNAIVGFGEEAQKQFKTAQADAQHFISTLEGLTQKQIEAAASVVGGAAKQDAQLAALRQTQSALGETQNALAQYKETVDSADQITQRSMEHMVRAPHGAAPPSIPVPKFDTPEFQSKLNAEIDNFNKTAAEQAKRLAIPVHEIPKPNFSATNEKIREALKDTADKMKSEIDRLSTEQTGLRIKVGTIDVERQKSDVAEATALTEKQLEARRKTTEAEITLIEERAKREQATGKITGDAEGRILSEQLARREAAEMAYMTGMAAAKKRQAEEDYTITVSYLRQQEAADSAHAAYYESQVVNAAKTRNEAVEAIEAAAAGEIGAEKSKALNDREKAAQEAAKAGVAQRVAALRAEIAEEETVGKVRVDLYREIERVIATVYSQQTREAQEAAAATSKAIRKSVEEDLNENLKGVESATRAAQKQAEDEQKASMATLEFEKKVADERVTQAGKLAEATAANGAASRRIQLGVLQDLLASERTHEQDAAAVIADGYRKRIEAIEAYIAELQKAVRIQEDLSGPIEYKAAPTEAGKAPTYTAEIKGGLGEAPEAELTRIETLQEEIKALRLELETSLTQIAQRGALDRQRISDQEATLAAQTIKEQSAALNEFMNQGVSALNNFVVTVTTTTGIVNGRVSEWRFLGEQWSKMVFQMEKDFEHALLNMIEKSGWFQQVEAHLRNALAGILSHIPGLGGLATLGAPKETAQASNTTALGLNTAAVHELTTAMLAGRTAGAAGTVATQATAGVTAAPSAAAATAALNGLTTAATGAAAAVSTEKAATTASSAAEAAHTAATHAGTAAQTSHTAAIFRSIVAHLAHLVGIHASTAATAAHATAAGAATGATAAHTLATGAATGATAAHTIATGASTGVTTADTTATAADTTAKAADTTATAIHAEVQAATAGFKEGGLVTFKEGGLATYSTGGIVRAAPGGLISGPGTETSDSIPSRLSRNEFVVKASAVRKPGVLPLLEAINQERDVQQSGPGFAGGGLEGVMVRPSDISLLRDAGNVLTMPREERAAAAIGPTSGGSTIHEGGFTFNYHAGAVSALDGAGVGKILGRERGEIVNIVRQSLQRGHIKPRDLFRR